MDPTEKLAEFAWNLDFASVPKSVVEKIRLCVIDSLANIIAAQQVALGKKMVDFVRGLAGIPETTVIGTSLRTSCLLSAFANGALFSTTGAGDGFSAGGNHPGGTVLPIAYSLLESGKYPGKDFLSAVIAGYEVTCRIAAGIHPSHTMRGFNPTGTIGAIGAAVTASKMLGLSKDEIISAMGIAGFLMPITPYETINEGYTVTPLNCGHSSKVGLEAAFLAKHGFTGDPFILEGRNRQGVCVLTCENPDFEKMIKGLGQQFYCEQVYLKPYPSVRHSHGPVEAILKLKEKFGLKLENISKVTVWTYKAAGNFQKLTDISSSPYACRMSIPFVLAAALTDGELGPRQFEQDKIEKQDIHRMAKKIEVREKREYSEIYPTRTSCDVEILTAEGEVYKQTVEFPRGAPENPFKIEEVFDKFDVLVGPVMGEKERKRVKTLIFGLENQDDMRELIFAVSV